MATKKALNPGVNFDSTDPLTSRSRFKSRRFDNIVRLLLFFIPVVFCLSGLASILFPGLFAMLIVDAIAIGGAYYFYILWDDRPIRLRCGKCDKIILSNTPWICGYKHCRNEKADDFPFVHKCEHCGAEPKAYRCHHNECGEMILLSEDVDATNYAHCMNSPAEIPEPDKRAEKLKQNKESKEDKIGRLEILQLAEQLRIIRKRLKVEKQKTAQERLQKGVSARMELEEAADKLKVILAETYKGEKLRRRKLAVDDCLLDELAKDDREK